MRFALVLLLMLLPSVMSAKGFKINKPEKFQQPANTIERVSKRTLNGKTFEVDSIGSGKFVTMIGLQPIHRDSSGTMVNLNFEPDDTTGTFSKVIRTGKFDIAYNETGAIRFERKQGFVEFLPAFDTTDVGIEFNIHAHGLKANYYLEADSPDRLAWGFNFTSTHENEGVGKGRVRNAVSAVVAELGKLVAWDAAGSAVPLTVNYTADSLTVLVDTAGAVFPITVDPSVNDTMMAGDTTELGFLVGATTQAAWDSVRGSEFAINPSNATLRIKAVNDNGSRMNILRGLMSFDLSGYSTSAVSIDSAKLHMNLTANANTEADTLLFVEGSWTGVPDRNDYNSFPGWADGSGGGAYGVVVFTDSLITTSEETGWQVLDFTTAGEDTLLSYLDSDTLRIMMLMAKDAGDQFSDTQNANELLTFSITDNHIVIYYDDTPANLSHVTTGVTNNPDTLKVTGLAPQLSLGATVDSVGTDGSLDSVGFTFYKQAVPADTITRVFVSTDSTNVQWSIVGTDSVFFINTSITADTLAIDTAYIVTAFSATTGTRIHSDVADTVRTDITDGTISTDADTVKYVLAQFTGTTGFTYTPNTTPITVRGFQYFPLGRHATPDTILDASDTNGPWEEGVFSVLTTDSLATDTTYAYRAFHTDVTGSYIGAVFDTLDPSTGTGVSIPLNVMGVQGTRSVN